MSKRGIDFANEWALENIHVEAYDPGDAVIEAAVQQMIADAKAEGITVEEIEEDMGSLRDFVAEQYESRTDEEVDRLASKDD